MLYGCGCDFVGNPNCLVTYAEMRFFWLLLSTIKCNGVPITKIYERKRCSASLGSSSSSGWMVLVTMVEVGSTSMICLLLFLSKSGSKSSLISNSLTSTTNDGLEQHSLMLFQGILWKSHHFLVSFFIFSLLFFFRGLELFY
jgi:hypothetical protein